MAYTTGYTRNNFTSFDNINLTDSLGLAFTGRSAAPTDADLAAGRVYYDTTLSALRFYTGTSWITMGAAGAAVVPTWAQIYSQTATFAITSGTFTITQSSNNDLIDLTKSATGAGAVIGISNSGTGADIKNGTNWSIAVSGGVGVLELSSGGTINASGGALTIGSAGTTTTLAGALTVTQNFTQSGASTFGTGTGAVTLAGNTTVSSGKTFTVTLGATALSHNSNTAASVLVTNNTITSYGTGGASTGMFQIVSTTLSTGTMLNLQATEGTLTSGNYLRCWDANAGVAVFAVSRYGALTIQGNAAGTSALTLTNGDVTVSSGGLQVTKAANAALVALTNNSATSTTQLAVTGSGVFTGNTTSSFITFTASGLTTGTVMYVPVAALTTGTVLNVPANAMTTGTLETWSSTSGVLTSGGFVSYTWNPSNYTGGGITGKLVSVVDNPTINASISGTHNDVNVTRTNVTNAAAITYTVSGSIMAVINAAPTIGAGSTLTDSATVLDIQQNNTAASTGLAASFVQAAGAGSTNAVTITANSVTTSTGVLTLTANGLTTGKALLVTSSGTIATTGSLVSLVASGLTTGTALNFGALQALTTGVGIKIAHTTSVIADTGSLLRLSSSSIDTGGATNGTLLDIGNTGATAATLTKLVDTALTTGIALNLVGSGVYTGSGYVTLTHNSATTGTLIALASSSLTTTGIGVSISSTSTGMTSGSALYVTSATTAAVATNGIVSFQASGNYTSTSNQGFVGVVANSTTAGTAMSISATALTTGNLLYMTAGGGVYTGSGLVQIISTGATIGTLALIQGNGLTTGTLLSLSTSGTYTGTAGVFAVTANSATTGTVCVWNATSLTTGYIFKTSNGATLTTGGLFLLQDNSADTSTRYLFEVDNNNSAATGAVPIKTKNTALQGTGSKFTKWLQHTDGSKTTTIWLSTDATTPNGNLTGTAGDICLNGPSSRSFYCTGGQNWTASNA